MARNQVQTGDMLTFAPVPAGGVVSGEGLLIGAAFGVCQYDADEGGEVEAAVEGVHALPKGAGAIAMGAKVYWTGTALTTVASGNTLVGYAARAAAAGDPTVDVKLTP